MNPNNFHGLCNCKTDQREGSLSFLLGNGNKITNGYRDPEKSHPISNNHLNHTKKMTAI